MPTPSVVATIAGPSALGSACRQRTRADDAPSDGRRVDERLRLHAEQLRAHEARNAHPARGDQHRDHGGEPRAPERRADEQQHESGQGEQRVADRHQCGVDGAAKPCAHSADDRSDAAREERSGESDGERDATGEHHSDEQVAPETIGAEQMKVAVDVARPRREQAQREHVANS